jgi:hypothetical protein
MTTTYLLHAWCRRPFLAGLDVEADTPEEAIATARKQQDQLLDAAEECNGDYPWDEFAASDASGTELLRVRDDETRQRQARQAQAILLDLLRHGVLTMSDGDAEFEGVVYAFACNNPDWSALLDAIGWENADAAIAQARAT